MSRSCLEPRAASLARCNALAGPGDEIVVAEPIYATYEAVIGASGAQMITSHCAQTPVSTRSRRAGLRDHAKDPSGVDQQPA